MVFEEYIKTIEANRRTTQDYSNLIQEFEKNDYSCECIRKFLDNDRAVILGALELATKEGRINIKEKTGKNIWRTVFEYCEEKGLFEELSSIEDRLYYASTSVLRRMLRATLFNMLTTGIFLGHEFYHIGDHNYLMKHLYPEHYRFSLLQILNF